MGEPFGVCGFQSTFSCVLHINFPWPWFERNYSEGHLSPENAYSVWCVSLWIHEPFYEELGLLLLGEGFITLAAACVFHTESFAEVVFLKEESFF